VTNVPVIKYKTKITVSLGAILIVIAVCAQFASKPSRSDSNAVRLNFVEIYFPGWTRTTLPLGETERLQRTAKDTLQFDDYRFVEFRKGGKVLTFYVAYWGPGRVPPQLIAQHIPDRCWVYAGMTCHQKQSDVRLRINDTNILPGQWRYFSAPDGQKTYTMFWHLVGNRLFNYGSGYGENASALTFWMEAAHYFLRGKPAQLFLRVTSNAPIEDCLEDEPMKHFLQSALDSRRNVIFEANEIVYRNRLNIPEPD